MITIIFSRFYCVSIIDGMSRIEILMVVKVTLIETFQSIQLLLLL